MDAFYYRLWQVIPLLYTNFSIVIPLLCTLFCTFLSTNATLLQK